MAEYGGKQRNQLSKVTGSSESKGGQLQRFVDNRPQTESQMNLIRSIQKKPNNTGLPDNLKTGIENFSVYSMDDVKVHYNSDKPAQLNALAYAQGTDIHVAPGQEKHLPHEAWHVVQQKQGRVQPTVQLQGVNVNDNEGLEKEADKRGDMVVQKRAKVKVQSTATISYKNHGAEQNVVGQGTNDGGPQGEDTIKSHPQTQKLLEGYSQQEGGAHKFVCAEPHALAAAIKEIPIPRLEITNIEVESKLQKDLPHAYQTREAWQKDGYYGEKVRKKGDVVRRCPTCVTLLGEDVAKPNFVREAYKTST